MSTIRLEIERPNEKQRMFLNATAKHVAFGGARGGGKSWAVRTKAKLMALKYPGIKQLIVRRTYPELINNHVRTLKNELRGIATYNDRDKVFNFGNGSIIQLAYCAKDADLDHLQGIELDIIYLDEATQLSEYQMKMIIACLRGVNNYPKHIFYTCNPGGQGHTFIRRLFVDRHFEEGEHPEDYVFIQSLITDNVALMKTQPDYLKQLESLPPKLKAAWLYGRWDVYEGQFFEDFRTTPDPAKAAEEGVEVEELKRQHRWTHVIEPFEIPQGWNVMRSYDFGYNKPFSCAWWAMDYDGTLYRIMELYGCTGTPNEGVKWTPDKQFEEIHRIETTHPWLKGRMITGVADPAIWDASRGEAIAETASKHGVFFTPGENSRVDGWMQLHYRFSFDSNGFAKMYIFENCKGFIRTIPTLMYDEHKMEDLDTSGEDHIADETRYLCMSRPVKPTVVSRKEEVFTGDPLDMLKGSKRYRATQIRMV